MVQILGQKPEIKVAAVKNISSLLCRKLSQESKLDNMRSKPSYNTTNEPDVISRRK